MGMATLDYEDAWRFDHESMHFSLARARVDFKKRLQDEHSSISLVLLSTFNF